MSRSRPQPTPGRMADVGDHAAPGMATQRPPIGGAWPKVVAITGAAGFIGCALSDALREHGVEVRGIDLQADAARGIVRGDTTEPGDWTEALHGAEVVVHTAAVVSNAVGLAEQWRVNVLGTRRVFEAASAAGVRRVVHVSSVRAFSDVDFPDGVDERWPVRPDGNPYVDTKIASEHVALQAHAAGEVEAVIVRPGDVYGPGSVPWVLKPLALMRARTFALPAMGRGIHSPVYVDDLVDGLLRTICRPEAAGQIFTLAGPRGVTTRDYFGRLARLERLGPIPLLPTWLAVPVAVVIDRARRLAGRPNEVNAASMRYLARRGTYSSAHAGVVLGYRPVVDLDEGMARTGAWLRGEAVEAPASAAAEPDALSVPSLPEEGLR